MPPRAKSGESSEDLGERVRELELKMSAVMERLVPLEQIVRGLVGTVLIGFMAMLVKLVWGSSP